MRLGYISDLHCEFGQRGYVIPEDLDVLVLAGDVHTTPENAQLVLKEIKEYTDAYILYVLGNHEYYGQIFPAIRKIYKRLAEELENVSLLEKDEIIINDVRFLGTTLWSDLSAPVDNVAAMVSLTDFELIQTVASSRLHPEDYTAEWKCCANWLGNMLRYKQWSPTVVITHHSPSSITCAEQYLHSPIKHAFHSQMDDLILETQPELWIYGHDHVSAQKEIGNTKLISWQAGYPHENGPLALVQKIEI
jgi:predicted MPP superfamily phosphohydrolase